MQYIKDHDENLYKTIKKLYEKKIKKRNFFKKYLNIKQPDLKLTPINEEEKDIFVLSAIKYLGCTKEEFFENEAKMWEMLPKMDRFSNAEEADLFWTNDIDKLWLSLNILVQLKYYPEIYSYILKHFEGKNADYCDYGCGSASMSFVLNEKLKFNKMHLYDINNYVSEFVEYKIKEDKLDNAKRIDIINENNNEEYDLIICLDVLEHLENSSEALFKMHNKLRKNGLLILKAAWECSCKTHLATAAEDFYFKSNGYNFFKKHFKQVYDFDKGFHINGVYKKCK